MRLCKTHGHNGVLDGFNVTLFPLHLTEAKQQTYAFQLIILMSSGYSNNYGTSDWYYRLTGGDTMILVTGITFELTILGTQFEHLNGPPLEKKTRMRFLFS